MGCGTSKESLIYQLDTAKNKDNVDQVRSVSTDFYMLVMRDEHARTNAAQSKHAIRILIATVLAMNHKMTQSDEASEPLSSSAPTLSSKIRRDAIYTLLKTIALLLPNASSREMLLHRQPLFDAIAVSVSLQNPSSTHHHHDQDGGAAIGLSLAVHFFQHQVAPTSAAAAYNMLSSNAPKLIPLIGNALQNLKKKTSFDEEENRIMNTDSHDTMLYFGLLTQHFFSPEHKGQVIDEKIAPVFGSSKELLFGLRNCLEYLAVPARWKEDVVSSSSNSVANKARISTHMKMILHFMRAIYTILSKNFVPRAYTGATLLKNDFSIDDLNRPALELFAETDSAFLMDFLNVEFEAETVQEVMNETMQHGNQWASHLLALREAIVKMLQKARAEKLMSVTEYNDSTDKIIFELNFKVQNQESFHEAIASYPNVVSILENYSKTRNKDNKSKEENEEIVKYIENIVAVVKTNYHQN